MAAGSEKPVSAECFDVCFMVGTESLLICFSLRLRRSLGQCRKSSLLFICHFNSNQLEVHLFFGNISESQSCKVSGFLVARQARDERNEFHQFESFPSPGVVQ